MIITSILLCIFANAIRWAELYDYTTVRTFKDYIKVNNFITLKYNLVWILITFMFYLINKI